MSNKKTTVNIGGKDIVLNFGVNRFYKVFKECTGKDILNFGEGFDADKMVDVTCGIVYAAYVAECKLNKQEPEFTQEQVFDFILDMDAADSTRIFNDFNSMMAPGEAQSQPNG